jgi:hypothetical protein
MSTKKKCWVLGLILAGTGVILARILAPRFDQPLVKLALFAGGAIIALAGVGVILYGIKKGAENRSGG